MIKPKDENQTSQRCSVSSKTIGTWSTTYRLREGEHSVNTGESFIQILAWKKNSTLKSQCVTRYSIKRTYILYNIANSDLVWQEHPCCTNIVVVNSMLCLWAYCQLLCINIGTDFRFWVVHFFNSSWFLFYYYFFFTEWMSLAGHNLPNEGACQKIIGGGSPPPPPRWGHPWGLETRIFIRNWNSLRCVDFSNEEYWF